MKSVSQWALTQKATAFLKRLCHYTVEKKYDLTLSLYEDGTAQTPECSHRFSGSGRHNLLRLLLLAGALCVAFSAIIGLCSLLRGKR